MFRSVKLFRQVKQKVSLCKYVQLTSPDALNIHLRDASVLCGLSNKKQLFCKNKPATLVQMFSCEFCEISESTFFIDYLQLLLKNIYYSEVYSEPCGHCQTSTMACFEKIDEGFEGLPLKKFCFVYHCISYIMPAG